MIPKFRAWDKENDRMIYPSTEGVCFELDDDGINILDVSGDYPEDHTFPAIDSVLMQSTGLLNCETEDRKNVEGWEGDIADVGWSEQTGDFNSHRIILKSPFDYSTDEARWLIHAEYIIIRGNIYENPELLE